MDDTITIEQAATAMHAVSMCPIHFLALREEVKRRGLWDFVATSGADAERRLTLSQVNGIDTAFTYEPLIETMLAIYRSALVYLDGGLPDGCPLCALHRDLGPRAVRSWVRQAARDAFMHATELGIVPVWRMIWFLLKGAR